MAKVLKTHLCGGAQGRWLHGKFKGMHFYCLLLLLLLLMMGMGVGSKLALWFSGRYKHGSCCVVMQWASVWGAIHLLMPQVCLCVLHNLAAANAVGLSEIHTLLLLLLLVVL